MTRAEELVSVVIPSYNRARLLQRALDSVTVQTYGALEILVVDDGSTDDTQALLSRVTDPRLRVLRHPTNRGGAVARNTGITASAGEFVAFLDSDDEWLPEKIERQVRRFREVDPAVGLVYTGGVRVYDDGRVRAVVPKHRGRVLGAVLAHEVVANTSCVMVRRRVAEAVGGFDERFPAYQDVDFWVSVAERFSIDFIEEPLVRTHIHQDSVRISNDHARRVAGRELFYRKHRHAIEEAGAAHALFREIAQIYQRGLFDDVKAREFYRKSIRARPGDATSYALLLSTFVPRSLYGAIARLRSTLRRGREGARARPFEPSAPEPGSMP
jgi:glycosyltransferase involved in cell wall biosynthesis